MPPEDHDEAFEQLLAYLRDSRGTDFTGYKRPSLHRLVDRRMRVVGCEDYLAYRDLLEVQPAETAALLDALLINVTSVFRDADTWQQLREELLPPVLEAIGPDEPVRVWSAACATGEEAYSLAVVLHELLGDAAYKRRVKIYATDIDEGALSVARAGVYSEVALAPLGAARRAAYFEPAGDRWRFRADLRPSLIFGRHDLLQDAPISRVLLLSCRNVLMYFTPDSQTRVLERFSFALHPQGLLVLGKAEMLLTQSQLFVPVSLQQRVFRARRTASGSRLAALALGGSSGPGADAARRRFTDAAFHAAPAAQVVLDDRGVVTLVNERAQRDLALSETDLGRPFHELDLSVQPPELRGTIAAVQAGREVVQLRDVDAVVAAPAGTRFDVRVAPLLADGALLGVQLVFEDVSERHELRESLDRVHHDLSTAYEELQSSSEELETTNEELQSAVEELETTNEELQSTNEELETMNEELQSTNEELQTLNDELRERTNEVDQSNTYLHGIVEGLETALVVVDVDTRVQLWNSGAERLTGLRSFEAEGLRLLDLGLGLPVEEVRDVLREVVVLGSRRGEITAQVTNRFGRPHLRRVLVHPLRRRQGDVHGAVLTLVDDEGEPGEATGTDDGASGATAS